MKRRIKLWIAYRLEHMFPNRYCWSVLLSWAMFDGDFPKEYDTLLCKGKVDIDRGALWPDGMCYCGKFKDGEPQKDREQETP